MTANHLTTLIISIAALVGAIMTIWAFYEKLKHKVSDKLIETVNEVLEKNNKVQERQFQLLIDMVERNLENNLTKIKEELNAFKQHQQNLNLEQTTIIDYLKNSILEQFKQDVRDVYYNLRDTGIITDRDKSYIDKMYSYYTLLGGNSDVHAKVKEISEVYSRRTHEAYDEKAKKTKHLIQEDASK